jgi:hypothetical protein
VIVSHEQLRVIVKRAGGIYEGDNPAADAQVLYLMNAGCVTTRPAGDRGELEYRKVENPPAPSQVENTGPGSAAYSKQLGEKAAQEDAMFNRTDGYNDPARSEPDDVIEISVAALRSELVALRERVTRLEAQLSATP